MNSTSKRFTGDEIFTWSAVTCCELDARGGEYSG
jgi:hypothetical protein